MPPRFAVTTATLYFPGALGRDRACLSCLAQEGHSLKHNVLGESKTAVLAELEKLPRRSIQRSLVFHNLHSALSAASVDNPVIREWETRYRAAQLQDREDEVIFDRELFYAIQPRDRLAQMIDKYSRELAE